MPNVTRFQKPKAPPKPSLPLLTRAPKRLAMDTAPELLAFKEATRRKILGFSPELRHRIRRALEYVDPGRTEATVPELIEYGELLIRGYLPNAHFEFQSSRLGGRLELGGMVADFLFPRIMLVIRIMGEGFHEGSMVEAKDLSQAMTLGSMGYRVIDISEEECYHLSMLIRRNDEVLGWQPGGRGVAR